MMDKETGEHTSLSGEESSKSTILPSVPNGSAVPVRVVTMGQWADTGYSCSPPQMSQSHFGAAVPPPVPSLHPNYDQLAMTSREISSITTCSKQLAVDKEMIASIPGQVYGRKGPYVAWEERILNHGQPECHSGPSDPDIISDNLKLEDAETQDAEITSETTVESSTENSTASKENSTSDAVHSVTGSEDDQQCLTRDCLHVDEYERLGKDIIRELKTEMENKNLRIQTLSNAISDVDTALHKCCIQSVRDSTGTPDEAPTGGTSLEDLPPEIIQKIFGFLNYSELGRAAQTCARWRSRAYDPILWQDLSFSWNKPVSTDELSRIVSHCTMLKILSLHGLEVTEEEAEIIASKCPMLQALDMGFISAMSPEMTSILANGLPGLLGLNVEGCQHVDGQCVTVICQKMTKLQSLNLSHCKLLDDESVILIAQSLPDLQTLNIDGISWITDSAVEELVKQLGGTLQHLVLDGAELSDAALLCLTRCTALKTLHISFAELITDSGIAHIKKMDRLTNLTLRKGTELSPAILRHLFEGPQLSGLTALDLSECSLLDDDCVLAMTQCCGSNLRMLSLSWCWVVSDVGVEAIVEHCRNLRHLDILGMDKVKGHSLARIPQQIPHLKYLDLKQCNRIDDDLVAEVVEQKSDLLAINYYGEDIREASFIDSVDVSDIIVHDDFNNSVIIKSPEHPEKKNDT